LFTGEEANSLSNASRRDNYSGMSLASGDLEKYGILAEEAANRAAPILLKYFFEREELQLGFKGPGDLITAADRESESFLRDFFREKTRKIAILAEEEGGSIAADRPTWVIDPLDGTTNFAHHYPFFSISIALVEPRESKNGEQRFDPVVGCVMAPVFNECFLAVRGGGATLNGKPILASQTAQLSESLLCTGFPYSRGEMMERCLVGFGAFLQKAQAVRRDGSAALDLAYTAMGRFDGFFETGLKPWDVAAGQCLVEEAGGKVSDYQGGAARLDGANILASNGRIHGEMIEVLKEAYGSLELQTT
jgi:myo-inositol-1(or 4)-monophosphatase